MGRRSSLTRSAGGVLAVALIVGACGSSDDKRKVPQIYASGGEAGDGSEAGGPATSGSGGKGGTGTGGSTTAGAPNDGGAAGETTMPSEGGAAGVTGSGGAAGEIPTGKGLFVGPSPTGNDVTGTGDANAPFATLAHAVTLASPGDTILLMDGAHDVTNVTVPAGVNLKAQNAGAATLKTNPGYAVGLKPLGDMKLEGLKFQQCGTGVHYEPNATGNLEVVNTSFGCAVGVELDGSVDAVFTTTPTTAILGNGTNSFLSATGSSTASISGGVLQNYASSAVFDIHGDSLVDVGDAKILDGTSRAVFARENAQITFHDTDVSTKGLQLAVLQGQAELTVTNGDWSVQAGVATVYECIRSEMNGVGAITLTDVKLHGCSGGINSTIPGELTLLRVEIYDHTYSGISLGNGFSGNGGTQRITDCNLHDNAYFGIVLGSSSNLNDFKMRGTSVEAGISVAAGTDAIRIDGSLASTYDFGTVNDPGNNIILGSAADRTGLRLMQSGATVYAVGNTWKPSTQGADAAGHYSAPAGAGKKLDALSPVNSGINYIEAYNGTTLRLAENP